MSEGYIPDKLLLNENGLKLERIGKRYKLSKKNGNTWNFMWLETLELFDIVIEFEKERNIVSVDKDAFEKMHDTLIQFTKVMSDWKYLNE